MASRETAEERLGEVKALLRKARLIRAFLPRCAAVLVKMAFEERKTRRITHR